MTTRECMSVMLAFLGIFVFSSCGDQYTSDDSSFIKSVQDNQQKFEIYTEKIDTSFNVSDIKTKIRALYQQKDPSPIPIPEPPIPVPDNPNPSDPITPSPNPPPIVPPPYPPNPPSDIDVIIYKIINIGKEVWSVVEHNRPVVDTQVNYVHAVPFGIEDLMELENGSDLQYTTYRTRIKFLGVTVCDITYALVHQYNLSYKGQGKYLANITVLPLSIYVQWGFFLNLRVEGISSLNVGSMENPIASSLLKLHIMFAPRVPLYHTEQNILFQFRGDSAVVTSRTDM